MDKKRRNATPVLFAALLFLPCALRFGVPLSAHAEIDSRVVRTSPLQASPLDVATTADGQRTYVLLSGGRVDVYDARGKSLGNLAVAPDARALSASSDGGVLYVASDQGLHIVAVELVHQLDVSGAPVKGPSDAPVTVAVFNDFQ